MMMCFQDAIRESFVFSPANENWKKKRKAMSHVFYKERMAFMLETLKQKISDRITRWTTDIDKSAEKFTVIDITKEFEDIFARSIIHIAFGEDINDEEIIFKMRAEAGDKEHFRE